MNPTFTVWGSYKVSLPIPACNYPPNCCAAVSRQPTASICWLKPLHNYGAISPSTPRMTSAITNQGSQTGGEWRLKSFSAWKGGRKLFLMSKMFWHPWVCLKWWGSDDNRGEKHASARATSSAGWVFGILSRAPITRPFRRTFKLFDGEQWNILEGRKWVTCRVACEVRLTSPVGMHDTPIV